MESGEKSTHSPSSISVQGANPEIATESFSLHESGEQSLLQSNTNIGQEALDPDAPIHGRYNARLYDTPRSLSPSSSNRSAESMNNHGENGTPPESPNPASPHAASTMRMGRLSLENNDTPPVIPRANGQPPLPPAQTTSIKRSASSEIPHSRSKQIAGTANHISHALSPQPSQSTIARRGRGTYVRREPPRNFGPDRHQHGRHNSRSGKQHHSKKPHTQALLKPTWRDSGYDSLPEATSEPPRAPTLAPLNEQPGHEQCGNDCADQTSSTRFPGLIMEPPSTPISKDQLAAEVKSIYAGLVMVEAKCIHIDASQANDPKSELGPEQWQALIALHRTLLYEHHDFLMATQHPSATQALRGLAAKYSMPARMWRHGIHSFLEVLRFRRPASQEYMLSFIYLAYQMMALLFETVPMFTDTWIECLGDLARYRMAIEDVREQHAIWGGVAGRWYNIASDRHPETGRLYHHLGILERPSVKKFCLYTKSLTCSMPFPNAKDSLTTLCTPIVQDDNNYYTGDHSVEAFIVTFHAQVYFDCEKTKIFATASNALKLLADISTTKLRDFGVEFVICNAGALIELGSHRNWLWQRFTRAINVNNQNAHPSANTPGAAGPDKRDEVLPLATSYASSVVTDFCYSALNTLIRLGKDPLSVRDVLPSVHAILVWLHSLQSLHSRADVALEQDTCGPVPNSQTFSWGGLCDFLNRAKGSEAIGARTIQFARQGMFLIPERTQDARPLAEDYTLRGLIWGPSYYPPDWFGEEPDDGGRTIENTSTHKARLQRVYWLAIYLASRTDELEFDVDRKIFFTPTSGSPSQAASFDVSDSRPEQETKRSSGVSRCSSTPSAHSDDEGYAVVTKKTKPTWASIASAPSKRPQNHSSVRVVGDESMNMELG